MTPSAKSQFTITDSSQTGGGTIPCPHCNKKANIGDYNWDSRKEKFRVAYMCWQGGHFGTTWVEKQGDDWKRDYQFVVLDYGKHKTEIE